MFHGGARRAQLLGRILTYHQTSTSRTGGGRRGCADRANSQHLRLYFDVTSSDKGTHTAPPLGNEGAPMGTKNRFDGVDEYAVRTIKNKVAHLVGRAGLTEYDRQDLEQDLILDLFQRLAQYDPTRSEKTTFIKLVTDNRVATILESRKAAKRDYRLCTESLNDSVRADDDDHKEKGETFTHDQYFARTRLGPDYQEERLALAIDLGRVLSRLPPKQRELYNRLLRQETILEISLDTGIPRSTLYDMKAKLQRLFEGAGLKEYL